MEQQEFVEAGKRFGMYLRKVREGRRLSLDAVEELSAGQVERVTKSHLSRIENGQATPSFTRLVTLSRIYGVPVTSLAERFEIDLRRQTSPEALAELGEAEIIEKAKGFVLAGRYLEALGLFEAALDRRAEAAAPAASQPPLVELRLHRVNCWIHLDCYGTAKEECEEILGLADLSANHRIVALENLIWCCVGLGRYAVALMALERAEAAAEAGPPELVDRRRADLAAHRGFIHMSTGSARDAVAAYRKALELYASIPVPLEHVRSQINLGAALIDAGELGAARKALEQGLAQAEASGFDRLTALALGNLALAAYRKKDLAAAESYALRSNKLARSLEYLPLVFRNCFYLWKISRLRDDEPGVKANERTLRAYVTRVEGSSPEVKAFRAFLAGEEE